MNNIQQLKKRFYKLQNEYLIKRNDETLSKLYCCIEKYINQVVKAKEKKSNKYSLYNMENIIDNILLSILGKYKTDVNYKIEYLSSFINRCIYFQCCTQNKKGDTVTVLDIHEPDAVQVEDPDDIENKIINNVDSDFLINKIENSIDNILDEQNLSKEQHNQIIDLLINSIGRKKNIQSMMYKVPSELHSLFKKIMNEIYTILTEE